MKKKLCIAIDGPASAGKSTVAKIVAQQLGYVYLDTGAMYRAVTWYALQQLGRVDNEAAVCALLPQLTIAFHHQEVHVNGVSVAQAIRMPEVTAHVSQVSAYPKVREDLVARQQAFIAEGGIVMDGRDIGTVVMPQAEVKVFLIASAACRAHRRFLENQQRGIQTPLDQLQREIEQRDHLDQTRSVSPLVAADDAHHLDATDLSVDQVVQQILAWHTAAIGG